MVIVVTAVVEILVVTLVTVILIHRPVKVATLVESPSISYNNLPN